MALSVTNERQRGIAGNGLIAEGLRRPAFDATRAWQAERGPIQWESKATVVGGFPGFTAQGGRLTGAHVRLSDRYLLVDEGRSHGFGLSLRTLSTARIVTATGSTAAGVEFHYRAGALHRTVTMHLSGALLLRRDQRRVAQALALLQRVGVANGDGEEAPSRSPLSVAWDQTSVFDQEAIIWRGRASAPLTIGAQLTPSDVWLTPSSLIWGSAVGSGVTRLPLDRVDDLVSAQLHDRTATPAVYLACRDERGERHELPFLFDQQPVAERNARERGAFVASLRARRIPIGEPAPLMQPWRASTLTPATRVVVAVTRAADEATRRGMPAINTAWPAPPRTMQKSAPGTAPIDQSSSAAKLGAKVERQTADAGATGFERVRAGEARALAALTDTLRALDASLTGHPGLALTAPVPTATEQTATLSQLIELVADGVITPIVARERKQRLLALHQATSGSSDLTQRHRAGLLAEAAARQERTAIMARLGETILHE